MLARVTIESDKILPKALHSLLLLGNRAAEFLIPDPSSLAVEVWFGHNRMQFSGLKPRPLKEAIVTIGGVATDEIDPQTMESKLVPHLYFAGEVMDIDGPTGGYNLTMAFATARMAVTAIRDEG